MTNLGFSWGFEPKFEFQNSSSQINQQQQQQQQQQQHTSPSDAFPSAGGSSAKYGKSGMLAHDKKLPTFSASLVNSNNMRKPKRKMRFDEDSEYTTHKNISRRNIAEYKSASINKNSHKKAKGQGNIVGRQLPIFRVIELLDKKQLTNMVLNLIDEKPELNQVIYNDMNSEKYESITKPSVEKSISYLESYLQEKVLNKLPYKVDPEAEYSYLRVQKNLIEFYTILSDFILNYLPPVEKSFMNCLGFINDATELVHKIPCFKVNKFNMYHYVNIYEQITQAWWNVLKTFLTTEDNAQTLTPSENDLNVFHMLEFNLLEKLQHHKEECHCDKFDKILEFVKEKVENYHLGNQGHLGNYGTNGEQNYMLDSRLAISNNLSGYGNFKNNYFEAFANECLTKGATTSVNSMEST